MTFRTLAILVALSGLCGPLGAAAQTATAAQEPAAAGAPDGRADDSIAAARPPETPASVPEVEEELTTDRTLEVYDASQVTLDDFLWTNRIVAVFADTAADPRFAEQMQLLTSRPFDLVERGVVVITDTDPEARSDVRQTLRPRGFQVTLIGKDGEVELRKPSPWSSRELSRSIDKMPLRQQEVREQKAGPG